MTKYIVSGYNGDYDVWEGGKLIAEDLTGAQVAEFLEENK